MLKRKIYDELVKWKESLKVKRKAIIIKGLRQVGKTSIIKEFAKNNYENVIYINFKLEQKVKLAFSEDLSVDTLIANISAMKKNAFFIPHKTVIIFDENQECSAARSSIKSFMEDDDRFDIIASGSLLGIRGYNKKIYGGSAIGYEHKVYMKPMDFEEFLWAKGIDEKILSYLKDCFENKIVIREAIHSTKKRYFKEYLIVGGMPDAVNTYLRTNDFNQVRVVLLDILEGYKDDYGKHLDDSENEEIDRKLLANINKVYLSIPNQLAKENKKFMYSTIEKKGTSSNYLQSIQWLVDYGLVNYCYNLKSLEEPLDGNKNDDIFKLYVSDTGLFLAMLDLDSYDNILFGEMGIYKGAIYENIVADAFSKNMINLYYYSKTSGLEIDFISKISGELSLIEVKAKTGNSKSAKTILNNKKEYPMVNQLIKIGDYNITINIDENNNKKITIPHYLTFLLSNKIK